VVDFADHREELHFKLKAQDPPLTRAQAGIDRLQHDPPVRGRTIGVVFKGDLDHLTHELSKALDRETD
jgi:hypothetical protein